MPANPSNETRQIERFLRARGWMQVLDTASGEHRWESPDAQWRVEVSATGYWAILGAMLDEPLEFYAIAEGSEFVDLELELVSLGAMPWECPWCGETGGEPLDIHSTEWQGCTEHGGVVEYIDHCCTLCRGKFASLPASPVAVPEGGTECPF